MAFEAYLYIEGVPGDSTSQIAKDFSAKPAGAGPIEIKSYGLGIEMPMVENRSATGLATVGRATFADFETAKSLERSSAALLFYCLSGKHIGKAIVAVYRSTDDDEKGKPALFMQIIYNHIVITEVGVSGSGDEMPSETLKFNYGDVEYKYFKTSKKTGKTDGGVARFKWDRMTNTGEKS
jgi:type VI protein secretion system component Hcp